jgi:hypothetical protein
MARKPDFDLTAAHRFFAADCFNKAWDLIEKPDRTPADDRLMVALNQASIFHWLNRPDVNPRNLSIGYWQAARIQALLGNAAGARRHAEVSLEHAADLAPFHVGYAHEALARAAKLAGDEPVFGAHLAAAEALAAKVGKTRDRDALMADLTALKQA